MVKLRKIARMNFYRRLQGIYRKFYRKFCRKTSKVVFKGLKVEKWWESGNEGWMEMLRGLGPVK